MAQVIIVLEDHPDGENVRFVSTPNFKEMARKADSGNELTSAEGMAIFLMNTVLEKSGKFKRKSNLIF
jgi:hypothetical protein